MHIHFPYLTLFLILCPLLSMTNHLSLFHKLRKTKLKALQLGFHQDNYRFYSLNRIIPTGLQLHCTPALGTLSPELRKRWNKTLYGTSIRLINILSEHCASSLDSLSDDINRLEQELHSCCTQTQWLKYNDEIEYCLSQNRSSLTVRRNKKIGNITKKRQKSSRFRHTDNTVAPPHSVVNLSSSPLSEAETSLLSKGLKFCPTPPEVNQIALSQDLSSYYRRIRLKEFFLDEPPFDPEPFYQKSTWTPPKNRVPSLETYIQAVSSQVHSTDTIRPHDNLPREERQALSSLKNRVDIIIKPADKGSAVVVMDRQQYIDEAMKHLNNQSHYSPLDSDPTCNFSQQIQSTLDNMKERNHLSEKAHKFLSPTNAKPARFYLLPKIHKPGNPGRPILSGNGSPTENISLFVDHSIKPLVSNSPSYIHDTPDFLRKLNDIKDQIPETAIIGTFDVSSLYTNIPHDEGILASCEALSASGHSNPPIADLKALMSHVLTKNNFTFMDKHYLQVFGTAMGTRMAPSFACLFMTKLEQQMLDSAPCRPWIWWRYIDDIFFIWTREEDSLLTFIDHINSFHRTIKFTSDFSQQKTHFLDVTVEKKPNGITTNLYTKPTDTHQYLHSSSCHPRHCKTGIAYSQALRLRRICSEDSDFSSHARNLKRHLCARGHGARAVNQAINKVRSLPRSEVLKRKSHNQETTDRIPLVTTFHPNLPPLRNILHDNQHILHTSDRLQQAAPNAPILSYRRPRNLRDIIVRAEVPSLTDNSSPIQHGTSKCTSNRCIVCKVHIHEGDTFTSNSTKHSHHAKGNITCTTTNVVYLITCKVCRIQYVGETKTSLKTRFYGHRSTVNTAKLDTPVGHHFNLPNHSITDMMLQGIEALGTRPDSVRASREKYWMRQLRTIKPHGLNIQEGND